MKDENRLSSLFLRTSSLNEKSPEAVGLQGCDVRFVTARPLTPGAANNNHDWGYADGGRLPENRVIRGWGHGKNGLLSDVTLRRARMAVNSLTALDFRL
jgi:hypothetical protein